MRYPHDNQVADPKTAPVWEITAAEFTESTSHSADGLSMRFPRVTRIREDKDWTSHTDLARLKLLAETSKGSSDMLAPASPTSSPNDDGADTAAAVNPASLKQPRAKATRTAASPPAAAAARSSRKRKAKTSGTARRKALLVDSGDEGDSGSDLNGFIVSDGESEEESEGSGSDSELQGSDEEEAGGDIGGGHRSKRARSATATRDACRYGGKCYQKNPRHRQDFAHPGDADWPMASDSRGSTPGPGTAAAASSMDTAPDAPDEASANADPDVAPAAPPTNARPLADLADVFLDKVFFVPQGPRRANLARYITAYGGTIALLPDEKVGQHRLYALHLP